VFDFAFGFLPGFVWLLKYPQSTNYFALIDFRGHQPCFLGPRFVLSLKSTQTKEEERPFNTHPKIKQVTTISTLGYGDKTTTLPFSQHTNHQCSTLQINYILMLIWDLIQNQPLLNTISRKPLIIAHKKYIF